MRGQFQLRCQLTGPDIEQQLLLKGGNRMGVRIGLKQTDWYKRKSKTTNCLQLLFSARIK